MKKRMKYTLFFAMLFFFCISFAQNRKIDSLLTLLKKDKEDTIRVKDLSALAWELKANNPDTAIVLSTCALYLAQKLNWKRGIAASFSNLGVFYKSKGDYQKALDFYLKSLRIMEERKDKKGIPIGLGNIGTIYFLQADYHKALDYYFKALKMAEVTGNKNTISRQLGNIGAVYKELHENSKALEYFFKGLKINEEVGDKKGIEAKLGNIGNVYKSQGDSASSAGNITFAKTHCYAKALKYFSAALKMAEGFNDHNNVSIYFANIGSLYTKTGNFKEAEKYLQKANKLAMEIKSKEYLKDINSFFYTLYDTAGKHQQAFEHYKLYITYRDSLQNEENTKKQTRTEMNFEFEKKEAETKAEQEKKDLIAAEEKTKQKLFLWFTIAGLGIVLVVAVCIFRSLRINKKKNKIITEQKELVEKQKEIVEEKQKEILDSIYYARRIQKSLLTSEKYISRNLSRLMK
ncbi:MAG: tetratricopeptide repeat protein [Bacteroidia bacterium]|nr:tetratricopeptide repeat protein [Bacteroidia bacterium]